MIRRILNTTFLGCVAVLAQENSFKKGYILYPNGDTIPGLIQTSNKNFHEYVFFKTDNTSQPKKFTPQEIMEYFDGKKKYKAIILPGKTLENRIFKFAEVMVEGQITLYKTKLKTDPILPPTEAYLATKKGIDSTFAVGKIKFLLPLVEDIQQVALLIKNHKYKENEQEKIRICRMYNDYF